MRSILLLTFLFSCSIVRQSDVLHDQKSKVTILTSSIDGNRLNKNDGRYFADKLSEFLLNDSIQMNDRSLVNAFEISFGIEGRYALSPKELQRLLTNFPSDYIILSRCREISEALNAYEIEVRIIDKNYKSIVIESVQVKGQMKSDVLREAAQQIASIL